MEPIIGIDLGTTNSEVACVINGKVEIIKENGSGILPSCVGLSQNGEIIVGTAAKNQATVYPDRTVLSIKRLMGNKEHIALGKNVYTPPEISAFILKELKERAQQALGCPVKRAVITTPAYFTDAQRQATREAGEIAGLSVVRILNEPTAAALAYESTGSTAKTILVYDLGGGTFDVSIVRVEADVVEVLASTGDNHLGGDDFDLEIETMLLDHIQEKHGVDLSKDSVARARLRSAAEKAKVQLSNAPYALIEEDHIARKAFKKIHLSHEISRKDFEELIEPHLQKTMDAVNTALKDAALLPSALDQIILVGGSTRIPAISAMLEDKFSISVSQEIDPDLCVAMGSAIQAAREMGMDDSSILLDITPYTFGTSALGEVDGLPVETLFVPIIRRNTKLPAEKSDVFWTVIPDQERAEVCVYQGENPNALDNVLIGKYNLELSPDQPPQSPIVIKYGLDLNGILKITAIEKNTGKKITGVIENAFSELSKEGLDASKSKIEAAWKTRTLAENETPDGNGPALAEEAEAAPLPGDLEEVIANARKALTSAGPEDKDEIINLIEDILASVEGKDLETAREQAQVLEDILFYLE